MYCVEISKIEYHPSSKGYILILKKNDSDLEIPILIGSNEAQSLSLAYEDIRLPRPTSHDLINNLINEFDGKIESVIIKKYEKGTFFCSIVIKKDSIKLEIDSVACYREKICNIIGLSPPSSLGIPCYCTKILPVRQLSIFILRQVISSA